MKNEELKRHIGNVKNAGLVKEMFVFCPVRDSMCAPCMSSAHLRASY
jgi:hypothetical protein